MKKYSIFLLIIIATIFSCSDDNLDPLKSKQVKKGTVLALRGTQLDNVYSTGIPGAEFYPGVISGNETFAFDAEYLSEDPTSLESFDIYAIKKTVVIKDGKKSTTLDRIHLVNVPFSQFKTTNDYPRPWVSVSLKLTDILKAIGITDYNDPDAIDELLTVYQPGIAIESDLNLKDGEKVGADQIVATGLFNSDQFYPAQKLTYNSIHFCPFDEGSWDGVQLKTVEIYSNGDVSPFYNVTLESIGSDKYIIHGFAGQDVTVSFNPATDSQYDQSIKLASQDIKGKASSGEGTYSQCDMTFSITVLEDTDEDGEDPTVYQFELP